MCYKQLFSQFVACLLTLLFLCKQNFFSFLFIKTQQFFLLQPLGFVSNLKIDIDINFLILYRNSPMYFMTSFFMFQSLIELSKSKFWNILHARSKVVIQFDFSIPNGCQVSLKPFCISSFLYNAWEHTKKPGNWCYLQSQIPWKTRPTQYVDSTITTARKK